MDITCKRDVINILYAHCGLVGPDCKVVPSVRYLERVFLSATLKDAYV